MERREIIFTLHCDAIGKHNTDEMPFYDAMDEVMAKIEDMVFDLFDEYRHENGTTYKINGVGAEHFGKPLPRRDT